MSKGYVYILTNEAMPGLVKIGKTTRDVNARAAELSNGTGVPTPFTVWDSIATSDCDDLERRVHDYLSARRVSPNREFFKVAVKDASQVLWDAHREIVEEFVEEFLPGDTLVPVQCYVDPSAISIIGLLLGLSDHQVCDVLCEVRCDDDGVDFDELVSRYHARVERNKKRETKENAETTDGVTLQ